MTPVKYHGGRNYTIDYHQIIDPRNTNPTKTSLSAADTTRTLSLSIVIPLQPYRLPSPTSSLSNPRGMPRHPPGAGGRRAPTRQPPSRIPFPRNSNAYHRRSVDTQPSQWRSIAVCWASGFGGQVSPPLWRRPRGA